MGKKKQDSSSPQQAYSSNNAYANYYAQYQQYAAQMWRSLKAHAAAARKAAEKREEMSARWSCQTCHVKTAALYVGLIEIIFVGTILAVFIQYYMSLEEQTEFLIAGFVIALLCGVTAVFVIMSMLVGVCRDMPALVIPHLIAQCVGICLMSAIGALVLLMNFTEVDYDPAFGEMFPTVLLAIAILCIAMSIAEVWFFFLVRDCYQYLKQREARADAEKSSMPVRETDKSAEEKKGNQPLALPGPESMALGQPMIYQSNPGLNAGFMPMPYSQGMPMQNGWPQRAPLPIEAAPKPEEKTKKADIVEICDEKKMAGNIAIAVKEDPRKQNNLVTFEE